MEHICFTCTWTEFIWFGGWARLRYRKEEVGRIEEWLLKLFSRKGVDEKIKAMIVVTCWFIWKERCSVQIENKILDVSRVIRKIIYAYEKLQKVKGDRRVIIRREDSEKEEIEEWKQPEKGWIKSIVMGHANRKRK